MKSAEFEKIADLLARQHKIQVKEGNGWAANIKTREVFYLKKDIYSLPEDHILGLLLHEIAHIHYTTEFPKPQINQELTHITVNMLEDITVEHIIGGDYPNAGEILTTTKEDVLNTLVRILPTLDNISKHEKALLYASARFEGRGYENNMLDYEILGNKISKLMIKNKQNIYKRAKTENHLPIAKKIVEMLLKALGQPTDEEKQQMNQEAHASTEGRKEEQGGNAKQKLINV
mgnify:CR=1 FL=1